MKSFISLRVYAELRPRLPIDVFAGGSCISVTGQPLSAWRVVQANLQLLSGENFQYIGNFLVCSNLQPPLECIIGWDILTRNGLSIVAERGCYWLAGSHGSTRLTPKGFVLEQFAASLALFNGDRDACFRLLNCCPACYRFTYKDAIPRNHLR